MLPPGGTSLNVEGELATINCPLAGSGVLTVAGSGTAALGGADTYGGTDLEGGTLQLGNAAALGSGSLTVNDGTLDLDGNNITLASLSGNGGTITNSSSSPSTLTVDQDANAAYYGDIQNGNGDVGLNLGGSGVLVDLGDNTFSGGITITTGLFVVTAPDAVPDSTALTIGAGGTFLFDPSLAAEGDTLTLPVQDRAPVMPIAGGTPAPSNPAPMVTAIQCVGAALVDADAVNFLVTFNKPVTGVVPGDFAVDGSMGGTVTAVSGSQGQFVVTVSGIPDGSGTLGLSVQDAGTIRDWFGTPLTDATVMLVDQQYAIDRQLYWDGSDGNAAAGGSGDWNGPNWHVGGPNGPLQQWCDGSAAFFGGVGGTISITAPVAASSLTFLSDGYLLQGDGIAIAPRLPPLSRREREA